MPHQCTECGRTFPDGSKEMLSGCPDCGGNKFQFDPGGRGDDAPDADASPPDRPGDGSVAGRVGRATATVKRWVSGSDRAPDRSSSTDGPSSPAASRGSTSASTESREESAASDSTMSDSAAPDSTATDDADAAPTADAGESDERAYGEWPNPDGADTAGVGKGPEDRRSRSAADDEERPDGADPVDPADGVEGTDGTADIEDGEDDAIAGAAAVDEDSAQANARTDVVSPDELPDDPPDSGTLGPRRTPGPRRADTETVSGDSSGPADASASPSERSDEGSGAEATPPDSESGRVASEPEDDERPDLEDLREELNDQFESIKIVEPGQYELNLMELYDREEYIISLQEDGRYVIEVPERWRDED